MSAASIAALDAGDLPLLDRMEAHVAEPDIAAVAEPDEPVGEPEMSG